MKKKEVFKMKVDLGIVNFGAGVKVPSKPIQQTKKNFNTVLKGGKKECL